MINNSNNINILASFFFFIFSRHYVILKSKYHIP
jgi:hypothetical protein